MKVTTFTSSGLVLFAAAIFGSQALAAPPVQHIFSNGQPADANQVNQNFQELADRIEAVPVGPQGPQGEQGPPGPAGEPVVINFDPYRHNFSSKTFLRNGVVQEIRTYDRSTPGMVIERRVSLDVNQATMLDVKRYYTTGQGQDTILIKLEEFDPNDPLVLIKLDEYDPGLITTKNDMIIGQLWSTHSAINRTSYTWDNVVNPPAVSSYTLGSVGVRIYEKQESTTANGVVYENCLKLLSMGTSVNLFWYCEGMGLVKLQVNQTVYELESTTP